VEDAVRYLCLVYHAERELQDYPQRDCDAIVAAAAAYSEELRASGHLIAGDVLQPVETATTIRVRNGKVSISDGAVAETSEQLSGFYLIEAVDLNEAIRLASNMPPARFGSIEVRPIRRH
jgi:hypothetical protein